MAPRPFTTVLVANRGEIARRVIRACRELGIRTVAVFSDADAEAPYVAEADAAVRLAGTAPIDTYLRGDLLIDAARATGADAVHPGYGFLSERADFAMAVLDAGLVWIGPPPTAISAMGSKIEAKALMRDSGVPVARDSTTHSPTDIGLPALVKASAGGGGRGMRIVRHADELDAAVAAAEREARAAFGDGTVFIERYVEHARHVEVQVVADAHGTVASLFERDCTVQRRHQKVVEEAPSPAVDTALRARMGTAAVAAAKAVGYVGAGTVEFLLEPSGDFWFLEMNTRLQVEHPVTESVTGVDLVRLQLDIAAGRALPREVTEATITGHAIEVRLCAEDPYHDYRPSTGTFHRVEFDPTIRADSAIESGTVVGPHYDSLVAKLIAHGRTRGEAARILGAALDRSVIVGPPTNRQLLRDLLGRIAADGDTPATLDRAIDTGWLDRQLLGNGPRPDAEQLAAAACALARHRHAHAVTGSPFPVGWRSNPAVAHEQSFGDHVVAYRFGRDGAPVDVSVDGAALDLVDHRVRDRIARIEVEVLAGGVVAVDRGRLMLTATPRFTDPDAAGRAGSTAAPMPGTVLRVHVEPGQHVIAGAPVVSIEAMKMEHAVTAPYAGTVTEILVAAGQQLDAGQPLVIVEPDATEPADDDG